MTIELTVIISILGVIIALLGYQVNKQKQQFAQQQVSNDGVRQDAVVQTKLDNISKGVEDIRIDLRANDKRINEVNEKLVRVDESAKQAHKRIDKLEGVGSK